MNKVFKANLHHTYADNTGKIVYPNSLEGDLLKQASREIDELEESLKQASWREGILRKILKEIRDDHE